MDIERNYTELLRPFDVVVIGGGITGLAIAREAAERGLRVCLVEKRDFGWATSSGTSKMIHGGLRYLENYEFGLVRESLRERRILGCSAGHLVRPLPFLLPVYRNREPGRWLLLAGLKLYDLLSFDRNFRVSRDHRLPASRWLSRSGVLARESCLDQEGLIGGFLYYDYQSLYPERLSLAFLKTAVRSGAVALNHTELVGFNLDRSGGRERVVSVNVRDNLSGESHTISGKMFVNATGPWTDYTLSLASRGTEARIQRSQGIHILTDPVCGKEAVFVRTKSGRHFFVLPWQGYSLIGPTDTPYAGHPDDLHANDFDVQQLIDDVNEALPNAGLSLDRVYRTVIGIRPLIFSGSSTYRASRKSEIFDHSSGGLEGLLSVAGGKWTTSRALGEQVVERLLKKEALAGIVVRKNESLHSPLVGWEHFGSSFSEFVESHLGTTPVSPLDRETMVHLMRLYGTEHTRIVDMIRRDHSLAHKLAPGCNDVVAQIVFAVESESARTLEDILNRRMAIGNFGYPGDAALVTAAETAGKILGWNAARRKQEVESYQRNFPAPVSRSSGKQPSRKLPAKKGTTRSSAKKSSPGTAGKKKGKR